MEVGDAPGGERLVIEWRESGVSMPSGPPSRRDCGSELITKALPYQLDVETLLKFSDDGVRCPIALSGSAFSALPRSSAVVNARSDTLRGRRILVVEDEYMIAQEIADELSNIGADTLGPMSRTSDALRLIEAEERIDAAILDVNLGQVAVWPVVDALLARRVPVMLATAYDAKAIPAAYIHLPRCEKPTTAMDLMQALAQVLVSTLPD